MCEFWMKSFKNRWCWDIKSFSPLSSTAGCHCRRARTCKSRKRAHWASAWKSQAPAPPRACALSLSQLKQHHLHDSGLTGDCGESACSKQILPYNCLLPWTKQTQPDGWRTLIGWSRKAGLYSDTELKITIMSSFVVHYRNLKWDCEILEDNHGVSWSFPGIDRQAKKQTK